MSFKEQIISKVKYQSLFSLEREAKIIRVFIILQNNIFHNTHHFENWVISLGYSSVLAGVYSVA